MLKMFNMNNKKLILIVVGLVFIIGFTLPMLKQRIRGGSFDGVNKFNFKEGITSNCPEGILGSVCERCDNVSIIRDTSGNRILKGDCMISFGVLSGKRSQNRFKTSDCPTGVFSSNKYGKIICVEPYNTDYKNCKYGNYVCQRCKNFVEKQYTDKNKLIKSWVANCQNLNGQNIFGHTSNIYDNKCNAPPNTTQKLMFDDSTNKLKCV